MRDGKILLYKQKGSPYWYARLKLKKGWTSRSTKQKNEAEAGAEAILLYDGEAPNNRKRVRSFQHYSARYGDILKEAIDYGTAQPIYPTYFSHLVRYIEPFFNKYDVDQIDDKLIDEFEAWRRKKLGKEPSKSLIGHQNVVLRAIFDLAAKDKVINRRDIPKLTLKGKGQETKRRPSFTKNEWNILTNKMVKWSQKHPHFSTRYKRQLLREYVLILANTGLRPGKEIETLRWKHIQDYRDKKGQKFVEIIVSEGKTDDRAVIARNDVRKYLDRVKELTNRTRPDDLVFCMPDGSPLKNVPQLFTGMLIDFDMLYDVRGRRRCCYSCRHFY